MSTGAAPGIFIVPSFPPTTPPLFRTVVRHRHKHECVSQLGPCEREVHYTGVGRSSHDQACRGPVLHVIVLEFTPLSKNLLFFLSCLSVFFFFHFILNLYIGQGDPCFCDYIQHMVTMSVNVFSRKVLCAKFCPLVVDIYSATLISSPSLLASELRWPADLNLDTLSVFFFEGLFKRSP